MSDIDWPEPEPWSEPEPWPKPEPVEDDWPEPEPAAPEPLDILDQPAGTPGPLACGCDAAMVIVTGQHLRGNHE